MPTITKILNSLFGLILFLFVLDSMPWFDIKHQGFKTFVYLGLMLGSPVLLLWNIFALKAAYLRIVGTLIPALCIAFVAYVTPLGLLFSSSAWSTQTLISQHKQQRFKTYEFQMQDIGTLGYRKRSVGVYYITPYFMYITEAPQDLSNSEKWAIVHQDINELGLKD